jgi:hypothetical protein
MRAHIFRARDADLTWKLWVGPREPQTLASLTTPFLLRSTARHPRTPSSPAILSRALRTTFALKHQVRGVLLGQQWSWFPVVRSQKSSWGVHGWNTIHMYISMGKEREGSSRILIYMGERIPRRPTSGGLYRAPVPRGASVLRLLLRGDVLQVHSISVSR